MVLDHHLIRDEGEIYNKIIIFNEVYNFVPQLELTMKANKAQLTQR